MIVGNINDLQGKKIESKDAKASLMKVLVTPKDGWNGYVMRELEVEPSGYTPHHMHPWPHINYIISGRGELLINEEVYKIEPGGFAYVPSNELHQFKNTGNEVLKFICIVPEEGHK